MLNKGKKMGAEGKFQAKDVYYFIKSTPGQLMCKSCYKDCSKHILTKNIWREKPNIAPVDFRFSGEGVCLICFCPCSSDIFPVHSFGGIILKLHLMILQLAPHQDSFPKHSFF
jgi:hypothetical protein